MRYRRNPENKFFPTPGQLLAACKSPFADPPPRHYPAQAELGPPVPKERAAALIAETRQKWGYFPKDDIEGIKAEIRARPKSEMTPEMLDLEKSLAAERAETMNRRLQDRHG
jgi:hypothetical protein